MQCHEIDYKIIGNSLQIVEVELDPNEVVVAEAGAMNYMEDGITYEAKLGDGSDVGSGFFDKMFGAGKRFLMGESLFLTHFKNVSSQKKIVAFSSYVPGEIIPLDLAKLNGEIICQKDSFLCAAYGTKLDMEFSKNIGAGLFGGEGFILESIKGDGKVFIEAGGTIVKKELTGEAIYVDTGCVVAFTRGINYDITQAGGLKSMIFGGEGLFLMKLQGYGTVYLQSLPFSRLSNKIIQNAPALGGDNRGEGSVLGGISRVFED